MMPMQPRLTETSFPLRVQGNQVYARGRMKPICIAQDRELALEIAARLNRDAAYVDIPRLDAG